MAFVLPKVDTEVRQQSVTVNNPCTAANDAMETSFDGLSSY